MATSSDYNAIVQSLRRSFANGVTRSYESRITQLNNLKALLIENRDTLMQAVHQDIHRCDAETDCYEIIFTLNELECAVSNLSKWMQPTKAEKPVLFMLDDALIYKEPLGVVLIIGAWNYSIQMTLLPLVGAIAAGNCAIVKPSEMAPNVSKMISELIPKYLDQQVVRCVQGGVPETTALLQQRFDHIFYTGNPMVGKIVMSAAAKWLTPVTLELGGKCPAIVDKSCDLAMTTKRIAWGKFMNCGQTCVAADYVLCVGEDLKADLIKHLIANIKSMYGDDPQKSADYSRIINQHHFDRLKPLLDELRDRVLFGGETDREDKYIGPTLIEAKPTDTIMQTEIFGPLLPIITVPDMASAIDFVNSKEKPLGIYVFSKDQSNINRWLKETSSGGVTVNDIMLHLAVEDLPFGGVGQSGMGRYHGRHSFNTFTHEKAVLIRQQNMEAMLWMRYPPFDARKIWWATTLCARRALPERNTVTCYLYLLMGLLLGVVVHKYLV